MNQAAQALSELGEMDALARLNTPVHRLHPLSKLLSTIAYIALVASFHKYDLSGIFPMVLYPAFLFSVTGLSVRGCFYKLRLALPLVCAVGIVNPFLDRNVLMHLGSIAISGGVISMVTLMLKGVLCLTASFLLIATTPIDAICVALRKIHVPSILVTLLLLTYRYVSVMMEEVANMTDAYTLRAPGQNGIHYTVWGSFVGQLLLRSMDRASELYQSMLLRGFHGEFPYAAAKKWSKADGLYALAVCTALLTIRFIPITNLLGRMVL